MKDLFAKPHPSIFEQQQGPGNDPRLKHLIKNWSGENIDVGLLGVPFDWGVSLSGGRPGAAQAPDAIRTQIKHYGNAADVGRDIDLTSLAVADFGNVVTATKNSGKTHTNITAAVKYAFGYAKTLVVLGGGNDISYATIKGFSQTYNGNIGGMNCDAHFDVREVRDKRMTSGTPYRRLLEDNYLKGKNFIEFATQGHVNSSAHKKWLLSRRARIFFLSDIRKSGVKRIFAKFALATKDSYALFVSIDIDSIAQAFAPGSSAPSPDGLTPQDALALAYMAGQHPKVQLFEIMEVSPIYDIDNMTSRLAVNIIFEFLAGYTRRA